MTTAVHSRPSQADRVQRALERAGRHGITQIDFDAPDVFDGGDPIKRVAARVHELIEQRGLRIVEAGRRNRCKIYRLEPPKGGASGSPASLSSGDRAETHGRPRAGGPEAPAAHLQPLSDWWLCLSCATSTRGDTPADCCEHMLAVRVCIEIPADDEHTCTRCETGYPCPEATQ